MLHVAEIVLQSLSTNNSTLFFSAARKGKGLKVRPVILPNDQHSLCRCCCQVYSYILYVHTCSTLCYPNQVIKCDVHPVILCRLFRIRGVHDVGINTLLMMLNLQIQRASYISKIKLKRSSSLVSWLLWT